MTPFHAAMSDETALTQSMMGIDGQVSLNNYFDVLITFFSYE